MGRNESLVPQPSSDQGVHSMIYPRYLRAHWRQSIRVGALVALAVALSSGPVSAQEPLLWGSLRPGPHAVGYRALYRLDHTRQYDPDFVTDPTKLPAHKPRPIYIAVWYPAQQTDAKPMQYCQYLDAPSDDPLITPF